MKDRVNVLIQILVAIILLSLAIQWLLPAINSEEFQLFIKDIGPFGPAVIILFTIVSHIFAPMAGSPAVLLGYAIFGVIKTSLFLYIASMISAMINFEISRRYGRGLVIKLVGKDAIKQVDKLVEISGGKILAVSRIFGFPLFEIISYAAGLTKISFKKYMTITALFGALPNLFFAIILRDADLSSPINFYIWVGGLFLVGFGFSLVMKEYVDKKMSNKGSSN